MKLKRFLNTALTFLAGNMLSKLISFFMLPIYTKQLLPEQLGSYDLVMSFINLVAPIAFFQVWDGMFRFSFDFQKEQDKQKVISNTVTVFAFGIGIYLLLFAGCHAYFHFTYFPYILLYGFVYALHYVYTYAARVFLKNKLFVFSGLLNTFVTALLNILWIAVLGWDIKAIYLASTIGALLQMAIIEWRVGVLRHFRWRYADKCLMRSLLKFSGPLCIATVSYWLLSGFTKLIINQMLGADENGLYAVANRFASMITLAVTVVQFAWNETAYLMAEEQNRGKSYSVCIELMLTAVGFGIGVFCLVAKLLFPVLIDMQYAAAKWLIPATIIGVGANSLAGFSGTLFMTEKRTGFVLVSTAIAASLNVILGFVGTKLFGLHGAVVALMVAFLVLLVLRLIKLHNKYSVRIDWQKMLLTIVALILSVLVFFCVDAIWLIFLTCLSLCAGFLLSIRNYLKMLIMQIRGKSKDVD